MRGPIFVCLPLLTLLSLFLISTCKITNDAQAQTQALLQFKAGLNDPLNHLSSWTNTTTSPCHFFGVRCADDSANSGTVVTELSLSNMNLSGGISPAIAALYGLTRLDLDSNSLSGPVPPELSQCSRLRFLNLSYNALSGELPDLSPLATLEALDVESNGFTGPFPAWVSNLTFLTTLSVGLNSYDPGETPATIGNLKNLTYLFLAGSGLTGAMPDSVFGFSKLETLDMSMNNLAGDIPAAIGNLRNLWKIELYKNNLTGEIPPELGKLTKLREIDLSQNQLSGGIPPEFAALTGFTVIQLYHNNLSGEIPPEWGKLRDLTSFSVYENRFSGEFPANFGRFSTLNSVDISENAFTGQFPRFLCHSKNLQYLLALQNGFSGEFPPEYSSCTSLQRFRINKNQFTGDLPEGLWGLPAATIIDVSDNAFTGAMSPVIGQAQSLNQLWVQNNRFTGAIPPEIGRLGQVQKLYLSNNSFSGEIPAAIGSLSQLTALHLEENSFSGEIPAGIGSGCARLAEIDVSRNALSGEIPASLSLLSSLNSLNLSRNQLVGTIPPSLQALKLSSVDFSSNRLTGDVPPGLLLTAGDQAFASNPGLCISGGCNVDGGHKNSLLARKSGVLVPVILVAATLVLVGGILFVSYRSFRFEELRKKRDMEHGECGQWKLESFHPLELDADEICGVGEESLIGSGGTGRVYRLELKGHGGAGGGVVAVKRLWKGNAARVMAAEMAVLGKVRHRNVLKLHACLSRGDLNFIVYEYMPRGNLHQALRREAGKGGGGGGGGGRPEMDWPRRRRVAIGAAKGLMYLHHDCTPAVIHRDIKSTNILLDHDYEPKIADFGIAVFAMVSGDDSPDSPATAAESTCFAGTHGYLAPELAYSLKVTEKTDVYSYGVVLLELVTGRNPIDPSFGEGRDIVSWLSGKLATDSLDDVLDPRVAASATAREREDMVRVLRIAVLCTAKLPAGRPTMRDVVKMLADAGGAGPCSPRGQPPVRVCSGKSCR